MVSIQRCCRFGVYLFYDPADGTVDSQPVPTLVFSSIPLRVCVCVCVKERERGARRMFHKIASVTFPRAQLV